MNSAFPVPPLRWRVDAPPEPALVASLGEGLGVGPALAALLVRRGLTDPGEARRFLRPELVQLADPLSLAGMAAAVEVIRRAVTDGTGILVHGDYDVDGQCATAVLTRALRAAGARVTPFVPHRLRDGYDLGEAGIEAAVAAGAGLILTCDCGITAVTAVAAARARGLRVVITDHHLPGAELPAAEAIVDPQQPADRSGLTQLCGTGIAFKLVQALVPVLGLPANLPLHFLDLVALATIADIVPLVDENRVLVRHGLRLLRQTRWPGLAALIRVSGLADKDIRAGQVGFMLAPRLNAAGRVGDAADGIRLLLTDDPDEALQLATRLEAMNVQRQGLDQRILEEAIQQVERDRDPDRDTALVLAADGWHPGVVGIVASRVVERYGRPAFLIALDGDVGKGSGRSISRFDLHAALHQCGDLLERFGGHHMAAGLTIRRQHLDAFRERFAGVARATLGADDLGPEQRVDLVLELGAVTPELERLCRYLEPCGMGNPTPVFGARGVHFEGVRKVGGSHLKGTLAAGGGRLAAIGFGWAERAPWAGPGQPPAPVDCAFRLEENEYQGTVSLQARIVALTPARAPQPATPAEPPGRRAAEPSGRRAAEPSI
ncbi:MAG: single-stranded-DNA-specific exonuclease RecJ [Gemmatimonadetes bacterium]|nr:single-stranded-DNA-specific exonuclease RecJ [Gemmatimonadota bacterium]